ncbi:hypothetical protein TH63_15265 [Rufibacter radiotolerans]|uniref:Uncharacterized protein n=1 Tax=Rufibacter radiotolerans TaxID=1379910 RepID=A0A0H4W8A8_9BACT|nr:hypothetical protein TH63_15265 [Rufibacter radiotolerans]
MFGPFLEVVYKAQGRSLSRPWFFRLGQPSFHGRGNSPICIPCISQSLLNVGPRGLYDNYFTVVSVKTLAIIVRLWAGFMAVHVIEAK